MGRGRSRAVLSWGKRAKVVFTSELARFPLGPNREGGLGKVKAAPLTRLSSDRMGVE